MSPPLTPQVLLREQNGLLGTSAKLAYFPLNKGNKRLTGILIGGPCPPLYLSLRCALLKSWSWSKLAQDYCALDHPWGRPPGACPRGGRGFGRGRASHPLSPGQFMC